MNPQKITKDVRDFAQTGYTDYNWRTPVANPTIALQ